MKPAICPRCTVEYFPGQDYHCPHDPVATYHPFVPYFDRSLGSYVSSFAERETIRRQKGLEWADEPTAGDLSARADRVRADRR